MHSSVFNQSKCDNFISGRMKQLTTVALKSTAYYGLYGELKVEFMEAMQQ